MYHVCDTMRGRWLVACYVWLKDVCNLQSAESQSGYLCIHLKYDTFIFQGFQKNSCKENMDQSPVILVNNAHNVLSAREIFCGPGLPF